MANSVDPDQTAPSEAVWSGSALFAYAILSVTLAYKLLGHLPYDHCCNVIAEKGKIWSKLNELSQLQGWK